MAAEEYARFIAANPSLVAGLPRSANPLDVLDAVQAYPENRERAAQFIQKAIKIALDAGAERASEFFGAGLLYQNFLDEALRKIQLQALSESSTDEKPFPDHFRGATEL